MNDRLTEDYLNWIEPQLRDPNDRLSPPNREFRGLMTLMYEKEFVWHVPNDGNRLVDGLFLRQDFCRDNGIPLEAKNDPVLRAFLHLKRPDPPGSFLEVLVALSRRLAFQASNRNAPGWAYILMANLGIHRMADPLSRRSAKKANDILDRCMLRTYEPSGHGGFFPLKEEAEDQTHVEIWYQMSYYLREIEERRR